MFLQEKMTSCACLVISGLKSSANNFADDFKFSGRSLMQIKKSNGPSIEPEGTPANIGVHLEY